MHELGLAEGILAVTLDVAGGEEVHRVAVEVGALQAIDAESLAFSFQLLAMDTAAARAQLEVRPCAGDRVLVDEVECGEDPRRVIRRPDLVVTERAGEAGDEHHHDHASAYHHHSDDASAHHHHGDDASAHDDHGAVGGQTDEDRRAVHPAWR